MPKELLAYSDYTRRKLMQNERLDVEITNVILEAQRRGVTAHEIAIKLEALIARLEKEAKRPKP